MKHVIALVSFVGQYEKDSNRTKSFGHHAEYWLEDDFANEYIAEGKMMAYADYEALPERPFRVRYLQ